MVSCYQNKQTHLFLTWLEFDCISTTCWILLYWGTWNILERSHLLWLTLKIHLHHLCSKSRYSPMEFTKLYNTERAPTHRKSASRSCIRRTHQPQSPSHQLPNSWAQHNLPCTSHLRGPSICPVAWAISSTRLTAYNQSQRRRDPGTIVPRQANRWCRAIEPRIRILQQSFVSFFPPSVAGVAGGMSSTVNTE